MTTIINTPSGNNGDSGAGLIVGVIIAIVIIVLFFVYGLPAIRGANSKAAPTRETNINVQIPNPVQSDTSTEQPAPAPVQ